MRHISLLFCLFRSFASRERKTFYIKVPKHFKIVENFPSNVFNPSYLCRLYAYYQVHLFKSCST